MTGFETPAMIRAGLMSPAHCKMIQQLPCVGCGIIPAGTVHHLKSGDAERFRGTGLRAPDCFGVPLCWRAPGWCHPSVEAVGSDNEQAWFAERGIDPHKLAADLWAIFREVDGVPPGFLPQRASKQDRLQRMTTLVIAYREGFQI